MRRVLSNTLKLTGLALGLPAGGVLFALLWPDVMNDLHSNHALRHFVGMFVMPVVLCLVICWPFWWAADKIYPEDRIDITDGGNDGVGPAATRASHRNERRHAD
jgi:hypothetical protein